MVLLNPYRPGAGLMPGYLAGRDEIIKNAEQIFAAVSSGIPVRSIAYSGYRGVGKTVLLNRLEEISRNEYDIAEFHIEVTKAGTFITKIVDCCKKYLRTYSASEKAKSIFARAIDAIKTLEISYDPSKGDFSLSVQDRELYSGGDLAQGLQDVFEAVGSIAAAKKKPICFFVDEFQYAKQEEMDAFISALHRAGQLNYPMLTVCAGTPEMIRMLYKEKTYTERMFVFPKLSFLTPDQVKEAIEKPGDKINLDYTDDAMSFISDITKGYPYFVQQFGEVVCNASEGGMVVDRQKAEDVLPEYYRELDDNFYMIRYEDRGDLEKACMKAMAYADSLPCTSEYIAQKTGMRIKQIGPTLSRLKNKGLIVYDSANEIDFTVPGFGDFIKRKNGK